MEGLSVAASVIAVIQIAASVTKTVNNYVDEGAEAEPTITSYTQFAQEINRSPEMGVFRRFGDLNNLTLLYMQTELMVLERKLLAQQDEDRNSTCEITKSYCSSMEALMASNGRGGSKQRNLLLDIQAKLKAYSTPSSNRCLRKKYTNVHVCR
jgi:hypothetical protein